jgi:hypothetical protein
MSIGLPEWNPQDKAASLLELATAINEMARLTFLKDGTHIQLAFVVADDGQLSMITPELGDAAAIHAMVKYHVATLKSYGVIHIAEAWTYIRRSPTDHTFKQVMQGEMRVSELAQGEKTEALMVRMESRDGATKIWFNPILRGGAAKVSLADPIALNEPLGGRLNSFFS